MVDDVVLRVALVVLAISLPVWGALSLVVVLGRLRYERLHRDPVDRPLGARAAERLVYRAAGRPRTEWGFFPKHMRSFFEDFNRLPRGLPSWDDPPFFQNRR